MPYAFCEQIGKEIRDISDEIPFEIPDSWEWVRCSTLGAIIRGSGIKRTETVESGLPCVRYGELYTTYNTSFTETISYISKELFEQCKQISCGDVLFTLTGENKPDIAKTVAYLGESPVAVGGDLAYWTHHGMNPLYLVYFMSSPYAIGRKVNLATGDIIVHISGDKVGSFLIPVPPLAEQDRIVAQINELEPIIQEYHSKEQAVSALNTTFPEALKKSILQEAVQGKLVPQNPDDEPASVLLERIRAEKQALIKAGKIKRDKHESVIVTRDKIPYEIIDGKERCIADEVPFDLPEGWAWSSINELFFVTKLAGFEYTKYFSKDSIRADYPVHIVRAKNVKMGQFIENEDEAISDDLSVLLNRSALTKDCLLMTFIGAGIGDTCLYNSDKRHHLAPNVAKIEPQTSGILLQYYLIWLMSPEGQKSVEQIKKTTAQPSLSMETIRSIRVAIPPLAEQKRIVAKIEELMQYCDKL